MPRGLANKTMVLIEASHDYLARVQPHTVRGVCYYLFNVLRLIPSMEKANTDRVSAALTTARERGLIPWEWIVDETREIEHRPGFENPDQLIHAVSRQYRKDRWSTQPQRVMVVSEKGTVGGILRPIIHKYGVPLGIYHGFGSATALNDLAERSIEDGRLLTILYVGDHDPSGRYMSDVDIPSRLARYGGEAEIVRLAVTGNQIDYWQLPTFNADDKRKDARYRWFLEEHGRLCCELDAVDPVLLRAVVEEAIREHIDVEAWERADEIEAVETRSLREFLAGWPSAGAA